MFSDVNPTLLPRLSRQTDSRILFVVMDGLGGAIGKLTGGRATRGILDGYTTVVRALPELLLIVMLYYLGTDTLNRTLDIPTSGKYLKVTASNATLVVAGQKLGGRWGASAGRVTLSY